MWSFGYNKTTLDLFAARNEEVNDFENPCGGKVCALTNPQVNVDLLDYDLATETPNNTVLSQPYLQLNLKFDSPQDRAIQRSNLNYLSSNFNSTEKITHSEPMRHPPQYDDEGVNSHSLNNGQVDVLCQRPYFFDDSVDAKQFCVAPGNGNALYYETHHARSKSDLPGSTFLSIQSQKFPDRYLNDTCFWPQRRSHNLQDNNVTEFIAPAAQTQSQSFSKSQLMDNIQNPNSLNPSNGGFDRIIYKRRIYRQALHKYTACSNCGTEKTSLWRRSSNGEPLCNACGLFRKLHGSNRPASLKTDIIRKRNRSRGGIAKRTNIHQIATVNCPRTRASSQQPPVDDDFSESNPNKPREEKLQHAQQQADDNPLHQNSDDKYVKPSPNECEPLTTNDKIRFNCPLANHINDNSNDNASYTDNSQCSNPSSIITSPNKPETNDPPPGSICPDQNQDGSAANDLYVARNYSMPKIEQLQHIDTDVFAINNNSNYSLHANDDIKNRALVVNNTLDYWNASSPFKNPNAFPQHSQGIFFDSNTDNPESESFQTNANNLQKGYGNNSLKPLNSGVQQAMINPSNMPEYIQNTGFAINLLNNGQEFANVPNSDNLHCIDYRFGPSLQHLPTRGFHRRSMSSDIVARNIINNSSPVFSIYGTKPPTAVDRQQIRFAPTPYITTSAPSNQDFITPPTPKDLQTLNSSIQNNHQSENDEFLTFNICNHYNHEQVPVLDTTRSVNDTSILRNVIARNHSAI